MYLIKILKSQINLFEDEKVYPFDINEKLGKGSYGIVYSIKNTNFVIKLLFDDPEEEEKDAKFYNVYDESKICTRFVNEKLLWTNILAVGTIEEEFKIDKYTIGQGTTAIIMPYFVKLRQLSNLVGNDNFVQENFLINYSLKICDLLLKFEDNTILKCTPEHKFMIEKNGSISWIKAKDLSENDEILTI